MPVVSDEEDVLLWTLSLSVGLKLRGNMARKYDIDIDGQKADLVEMLCKSIQSAHLNFLFGSGCASPAIAVLGNIEKEIQAKYRDGDDAEAERMTANFIKPLLEVTKNLIGTSTGDTKAVLENHKAFVEVISQILVKRASNILPKQASIFSTNYDLFFEKAFEENSNPVRVNDGFNRSSILSCAFPFSSAEFFNSVYNNGNLYEYEVQIPSINLVKLHGSLNWISQSKGVEFKMPDLDSLISEYEGLAESKEHKKFNDKFSIVLPKSEKFEEAVLSHVYYDLLRLYANQMDKECVLLMVEGFSFGDEHILEITRRALKNPTLKLVIFCYKIADMASFDAKFSGLNNVDIVFSTSSLIDLKRFSELLTLVIPGRCALAKTTVRDE